jgi:hypothetical protein
MESSDSGSVGLVPTDRPLRLAELTSLQGLVNGFARRVRHRFAGGFRACVPSVPGAAFGRRGRAMGLVTDHLTKRGFPSRFCRTMSVHLDRPGPGTGVEADEVLKTVSLDTASGHALAVNPASRRLQMTLVRRAVGDPHVSLATEDELEHDFPEFELGSLPPLGSLLHVTIYVDTEVMAHDTVVFLRECRASRSRSEPRTCFAVRK